MNGLVHLIESRRQRSCVWCGVAVLVALCSLGLMIAHLWKHP